MNDSQYVNRNDRPKIYRYTRPDSQSVTVQTYYYYYTTTATTIVDLYIAKNRLKDESERRLHAAYRATSWLLCCG